jgi:tripeptidyl-peptidase I
MFKTPSTPSKRKAEPRMIEGRSVPSSCADTITPACLQALYGIPTEAANSTTNQLLVTAYVDEYANRDDLEVSGLTSVLG